VQSNGKKTTTTTGGAIVLVFSLLYPDMIKIPQKQINFIIYIRYQNFLQKISKKICKIKK
jgi:hypothetical protein